MPTLAEQLTAVLADKGVTPGGVQPCTAGRTQQVSTLSPQSVSIQSVSLATGLLCCQAQGVSGLEWKHVEVRQGVWDGKET